MSVSQERFGALVRAATENRGQVTSVAVTGFTFVLTLKSRRNRLSYDVHGSYEPATDSWAGIDPYRGGTLASVISEIARLMKEQ